ncbi:MAG: hypothetical protein AAB922_06485 [Patescibacteria group bacterium]
MKTLTIGAGEIGKSLHQVFSEKYESYLRDKEDLKLENIDVLNICYLPSKDFVKNTKEYIKQYKPRLTIIHSTVAPGTTAKCGEMVVHSPTHGKHPNLVGGIKTFVKYIGGDDTYAVYIADKFLKGAGIKTKIVANSKTSELSKIFCTSYYGWNLLFMKEMAKMCKKENVPFHEVYIDWNWLYNIGYEQLGMPQFRRPVLEPIKGKIGGHCVVENCTLYDNFITRTIKEKNEEYKKEN